MKRREQRASIEQHRAVSRKLMQARALVHDAMHDLGMLANSPHRGTSLAKDADALMKLERAIDRARCRLENAMFRDHPDAPDSIVRVYYPGRGGA